MTHTQTQPKGKQKRTYVLPSEILEELEASVAPGKRGEFIAAAVKKQLEEARRAELRARMEEFYNDEESQELYAQIDRECSPASDEVWALLPVEDPEDWPEPVVVFPRGYAAYLAENEGNRHGK